MKYSIRPSYLDIERQGQPWIALYILGDLAYFSSLLGGICGAIFWILWPVFRAAKGQDPRWLLIITCLAAHVIISVVVFCLSVYGMRCLFARFDVKKY